MQLNFWLLDGLPVGRFREFSRLVISVRGDRGSHGKYLPEPVPPEFVGVRQAQSSKCRAAVASPLCADYCLCRRVPHSPCGLDVPAHVSYSWRIRVPRCRIEFLSGPGIVSRSGLLQAHCKDFRRYSGCRLGPVAPYGGLLPSWLATRRLSAGVSSGGGGGGGGLGRHVIRARNQTLPYFGANSAASIV